MTDMPVLRALDFLFNLLSQPENQGHFHTWAQTEFQQGGKIFSFREGD